MSYTIKVDPDAADLLVANILREAIENNYNDDDPEILKALVVVYNFFSVPDQHIQLEDA